MAVAHSAASESHTGTTGSASQAAFTWTHTQTGTPQGVLIFIYTFNSTTALVQSVTYGGLGVSGIFVGQTDTAGEPGRIDMYYTGVANIPSGNQTITVNRTNNTTVMYATAATVTASYQTEAYVPGVITLQNDQALVEQSVSDGYPGSFSLRYAGVYSGLQTPPGAGASSTLLNSIDIGNYGAAMVRETTAGQGPRNVGFSGGSDDVAAFHVAIREVNPRRIVLYT